ncbi:MAG TPA: hypothetical protein VES00_12970 [Burkholderiaceae bacterium]|jgi:hypothetical protein|nr:hypothetical protein [Burkholderiaceae bacterium]
MSLSTNSSTASPYAAVNTGCAGGGGVLQAIEAVPGKIVDGVEDVGAAVGDVASATVSFSERALQALADGGLAVVHGVENVVSYPFELAADVAVGAEHAVEGGIHLLASGVGAVVDGVETVAQGAATALHAVAVDLPEAIASDVASVAQATLGSATTVAGAAAGVAALTGTSPIKVINSVL